MVDAQIAMSGEVGSGKSTVAAAISARLGRPAISSGDVLRAIAAERNLTALETNLAAETDVSIDDDIDGRLRAMDSTTDLCIVDSRMAWHFVQGAFKVHLVVDPLVAADRLFTTRNSRVEQYRSVEDAVVGIAERQDSERRRFETKYGVDVGRLTNYDLVVDTSDATPDEIAAVIVTGYQAHVGEIPQRPTPEVWVSPERVIVGHDAAPSVDGLVADPLFDDMVRVSYERPSFVLLGGHEVLDAALRDGRRLHLAVLVT